MVKQDAVVIDVGFTEVHDSESGKWRVIGDVDFNGDCLQFMSIMTLLSCIEIVWTDIFCVWRAIHLSL